MSGPDWGPLHALGDVSRETLDRLKLHHDLLARWNPRINLVSRASLTDAIRRHFADSAQLWRLRCADARLWLDLGSGAGFPGLVVAAYAADAAPELEVRLVESDQRKAAFLREVITAARLNATVLPLRIEALPPQAADVVSARALAPLTRLLDHAEIHRKPGGIGLFPKGETVHKEIEEAGARWRFAYEIHPSLTEPRAAVVQVGAMYRV